MHANNNKMDFQYLQVYRITKTFCYQTLLEIFLSLGRFYYWVFGRAAVTFDHDQVPA